MEDKALRLLFAINPISGGKAKNDWEQMIKDFFKDQLHEIEFYPLNGKTDETSLKQSIERFKPHRVVAVGGDGTISMVAKVIAGTDIALGILPAGSANGMAKEVNIPLDATDAIDLLVNGEVKNADLININGNRPCLHLSDIGLNAQLVKHFEEGKLRGKWGYARVLLKVLWNKSPMKVRIVTKDEEVTRNAFMVVLANARKYGTGAVINPEGNLYDGFFEVVIIRRLALSEILKSLFRPRPFNPKKFEVIKATTVSIKTRHRVHFQVDGEYLGKVNSVTAEILPGNLKIVVPHEVSSS